MQSNICCGVTCSRLKVDECKAPIVLRRLILTSPPSPLAQVISLFRLCPPTPNLQPSRVHAHLCLQRHIMVPGSRRGRQAFTHTQKKKTSRKSLAILGAHVRRHSRNTKGLCKWGPGPRLSTLGFRLHRGSRHCSARGDYRV